MRIKPLSQQFPNHTGWVIVRGVSKPSYFSFFVDGSGSSWSKYEGSARLYRIREDAADDLQLLLQRSRIRAQESTTVRQARDLSNLQRIS